jgi:hypothetical protein
LLKFVNRCRLAVVSVRDNRDIADIHGSSLFGGKLRGLPCAAMLLIAGHS